LYGTTAYGHPRRQKIIEIKHSRSVVILFFHNLNEE